MTSPTTRDRVISAACTLFAEHGFRGASVRDICNLARANPGAISYHFGGKRQLYRIVLRHAVEHLAATPSNVNAWQSAPFEERAVTVTRTVAQCLVSDPTPARLILRDLADGGAVAVEALVPVLRTAFENLRAAMGQEETVFHPAPVRELFLALAAPVFLLSAAWPVLERTLDLEPEDREALLDRLLARTLEAEAR